MSIYTKPTTPKNGDNYIDASTGEIFVYLAGNWINTYLSNERPLRWVSDNSFICKDNLAGSYREIIENQMRELGLETVKKSRKLGHACYTIEDVGEIAAFKLYFNDMLAN